MLSVRLERGSGFPLIRVFSTVRPCNGLHMQQQILMMKRYHRIIYVLLVTRSGTNSVYHIYKQAAASKKGTPTRPPRKANKQSKTKNAAKTKAAKTKKNKKTPTQSSHNTRKSARKMRQTLYK